MARVTPAVGRVGRSAVVAWLRSVLDVLAALTLVDPEAVLNELSHKLADPAADSSSGLPLVMSGIARLLQQQRHRRVLLPYLGYAAALAVQALDPARPALRATMYQPVTALVRELTTGFAQVACHSSTLQLAVGSTRALGLKPKDASSAGSGVMHWTGADPVNVGAGRVMLSGELLQATAVAVFDMNGGTKKKVLLLPVLLQTQQQQQVAAAGPHGGGSGVSLAGSNGSLATSNSGSYAQGLSEVGKLQQKLPGGIPGLWSSAEGCGDSAQCIGEAASANSSSSSLRGMAACDNHHLLELQQQQVQRTAVWSGSSSQGAGSSSSMMRSGLTSNSTVTRAEAAMVQHWFGSSDSIDTRASSAQDRPISGLSNGAASDSHGPSVAPMQVDMHATRLGPDSQAARPETLDSPARSGWGVWQLHANRGSHYPSTAGAHLPVMAAEAVAAGVTAVAFNPAGDAVVAFMEGCRCCVVWKLAANWTHRLTSLGSSKPSTHEPYAYIAVPMAQALSRVAGAQECLHFQQHHATFVGHQQQRHMLQSIGAGAGDLNRWQLKWQSERLVDLLYHGRHCATIEVML